MHERCMHELMHLCTIHLCPMEEEDKEMEGGLDMNNGLDMEVLSSGFSARREWKTKSSTGRFEGPPTSSRK